MTTPLEILFEDNQVLVLDKPPNLVVNRAETVKEKSLQDQLEDYFGIKDSYQGIGGRAGIVHRLDKGTSGLLVVAKTVKAFENLQAQFKKRLVSKKYLSLVHGKITDREFIINAPVGRNPKNRMKFAIVTGARKAETRFEADSHYTKGPKIYTFLKIFPKTGRTHQVRVHLTAYGHPVVADKLYASRKMIRDDKKWCPRLFLHACFLKFTHPGNKEEVEFESVLSEDLREALSSCKKIETL